MTKEKLKSLNTYVLKLKEKLASNPVPEKHTCRVDQYRAMLEKDLKLTLAKIEEEKIK